METEQLLPKVIIEKRRHRVLCTKNTEYHIKDDVCVAVRKIATGDYLLHSKVLGAKLIGTLRGAPMRFSKLTCFLLPEIGDNLLFISTSGEDIVTTKVRAIVRPPKEALKYYLRLQ